MTFFFCLLLVSQVLLASPETSPFDAAWLRRADLAQAAIALEGYQGLWEKSAKTQVDLSWRVSMAAYYFGHRGVSSEEKKAEYFSLGRDAALRGFEQDPNCAPCSFWGGVNIAMYGDAVGILKTLIFLPRVRQLLRRSAELDPGYAYGGAYRVLALIDVRVPGIFGGDNSRARGLFEKAIAIAPDEPLNYLGLAKLLEDEFGDAGAALTVARRALAFPLPGVERVEAREARGELEQYVSARSGVSVGPR